MAKAIDPICQMEVDTNNPTGGKSQYGESTYYFCAPGCKRTFDQAPEKYQPAQAQAAPQKGSLFSRLFGRKS